MFVTQREVTESQVEVSDRRLDYPGVATLTSAWSSLLLALDEGSDLGFTSPTILALFAFAVLMLVAFARRSSRVRVSTRWCLATCCRNRVFTAANISVLLMSAIFFSALAVPPAVLHEGARVLGAGVGRGPPADDGGVRGDVVRRRIAVRATRREEDRLAGGGVPRGRDADVVVARRRLELRSRSCPG